MRPGLEPGLWHQLEFDVTPEMCPHFDGLLVHPVCATWTIIRYMELAGRRLLVPHLEPHEEGVGAHISIDHKAMAPIGARVSVRAEVESCRNNRLMCAVQAGLDTRCVALGRFLQVVLPKERLATLIKRRPPG